MDEKTQILLSALQSGNDVRREVAFRGLETMLASGDPAQIIEATRCLVLDEGLKITVQKQLLKLETIEQNRNLRRSLQAKLGKKDLPEDQFLAELAYQVFRKSCANLHSLASANEYKPADRPLPDAIVFAAMREFFEQVYQTEQFAAKFRQPLANQFGFRTGQAWNDILNPKKRKAKTLASPIRQQVNADLSKNRQNITEQTAADAFTELALELWRGKHQIEKKCGLGSRWFGFAKFDLFVKIRTFIRDRVRELDPPQPPPKLPPPPVPPPPKRPTLAELLGLSPDEKLNAEDFKILFDQLGEPCREILHLKILEEYKYKEIAQKMNCPTDDDAIIALKQQAYRCRKKFRDNIESFIQKRKAAAKQ